MTDSGVDSELSPSSPDSVTETRGPGAENTARLRDGALGVTEVVTSTSTAEELVARMEEEDEEKFVIDEGKMEDKMETVEALLSLGESSRGQEKPLITLMPAHSPDTGENSLSSHIMSG